MRHLSALLAGALAFAVSGATQVHAEPISRLDVVKGSAPPEPIAIPADKDIAIRVGRSAGNDVVFSDPTVSRFHATVRCHRRECVVEDTGTEGKGSTNGTFVNKKNIGSRQSARIKRNDVIELGPDAHILAK